MRHKDKTPSGRRRRGKTRVVVLVLAVVLLGGAGWLVGGMIVSGSDAAFFRSDEAKARYMAAYDAVLEEWPVAYEDVYIPTSLGLTHVVASGPEGAPPLVLLHAALATATVWRPNVEALSRDFRVYAVDIIGQGGKTEDSRKIKSRRDYADWLNELFDGLGIERASIVGNSYGGFIALNQAALAPERVERVVLISPAGVFVPIGPLMRRMAFSAARGQLLRLFGQRPPALDLSFILAGRGRFNPDDEDWLALGRLLLDGSVRPSNMIIPASFSREELAAIEAPMLLLIAEHEILYDPDEALARATERMPQLEAEIVRDAHHLAAMAQPDLVNARILSFLTDETRIAE